MQGLLTMQPELRIVYQPLTYLALSADSLQSPLSSCHWSSDPLSNAHCFPWTSPGRAASSFWNCLIWGLESACSWKLRTGQCSFPRFRSGICSIRASLVLHHIGVATLHHCPYLPLPVCSAWTFPYLCFRPWQYPSTHRKSCVPQWLLTATLHFQECPFMLLPLLIIEYNCFG